MTEVYVVTHGDYSDYAVECVFEREEDAQTYVRLSNTADVRHGHDMWARSTSDYGRREAENHKETFEECPACQRDLAQGGERHGAYRVERFAFHPAGEVPHADASNQDKEQA